MSSGLLLIVIPQDSVGVVSIQQIIYLGPVFLIYVTPLSVTARTAPAMRAFSTHSAAFTVRGIPPARSNELDRGIHLKPMGRRPCRMLREPFARSTVLGGAAFTVHAGRQIRETRRICSAIAGLDDRSGQACTGQKASRASFPGDKASEYAARQNSHKEAYLPARCSTSLGHSGSLDCFQLPPSSAYLPRRVHCILVLRVLGLCLGVKSSCVFNKAFNCRRMKVLA
jgi:hypothetical protein